MPQLPPSPLLGGAGNPGPAIVPGKGPGGKGPPRCLWIALENASPLLSSWRAPILPSRAEQSAVASAGPPHSAPRPPDSIPCFPGHIHRQVKRTQARIRAAASPATNSPSPTCSTPSEGGPEGRTPAPYTSASQTLGTAPSPGLLRRAHAHSALTNTPSVFRLLFFRASCQANCCAPWAGLGGGRDLRWAGRARGARGPSLNHPQTRSGACCTRSVSPRQVSVDPVTCCAKNICESRCMQRLFRSIFRGLATPKPLLFEEMIRLAERTTEEEVGLGKGNSVRRTL